MKSEVTVGPTTVVGWGTAASAFVLALLAYVTGDHTAQSVTSIEVAGGGLLVLGITQTWRYAQAHRQKGVLGEVEKLTEKLGLEPGEIGKAVVEAIEKNGGLTVQLPTTATVGGDGHAQAA